MSAPLENPPASAVRNHSGTAAVIALILCLLTTLALPGFIAGIWSHATHQQTISHFRYASQPPAHIDYFLIPATRLNRIPAISRLYQWEYRIAGGSPEFFITVGTISATNEANTSATTPAPVNVTADIYNAPVPKAQSSGTLILKGSCSFTGTTVVTTEDLWNSERKKYGTLTVDTLTLIPNPGNMTFDIPAPFPSFPPASSPDYRWMLPTGQRSTPTPAP